MLFCNILLSPLFYNTEEFGESCSRQSYKKITIQCVCLCYVFRRHKLEGTINNYRQAGVGMKELVGEVQQRESGKEKNESGLACVLG